PRWEILKYRSSQEFVPGVPLEEGGATVVATWRSFPELLPRTPASGEGARSIGSVGGRAQRDGLSISWSGPPDERSDSDMDERTATPPPEDPSAVVDVVRRASRFSREFLATMIA